MASTNELSAQAHLAAGMQKLEALRRQFLEYHDHKEQEVLARVEAGQCGGLLSKLEELICRNGSADQRHAVEIVLLYGAPAPMGRPPAGSPGAWPTE